MVNKTVRRAISGLASAFTPVSRAAQRTAHTLRSAQQHADEAWKHTMRAGDVVLHRKNREP
jgi:hypothetical protein